VSELLDGIRVLESAALYNGDSLGMLLGDLGADVIKIESPFRGDYLRDFLGQITPHHSPAHLQVNKNKRSIALDLRQDIARDVFWKLLDTADVFVDGNAADACEKLGIGYAAQRRRKPDIVYCQYTGYGSDGPYRDIPTHGQMMNALVAATPTEKDQEGFLHEVPGGGPMGSMRSGGEGTMAGAGHAAMHVAAALVRRMRTGEGCFIDVAGHDGVVLNAWIASCYLLNDQRITDRVGMPARADGQSTGARYQFYETKDQLVLLFCAIEPKFWANFCRAIERKDLIGDDDVGGVPVDFAEDDDDLRRELQRIFHTRDLRDWVEVAAQFDIPMGPAYRTLDEARDDPHLQTRALFVEGDHPHAGPFTYVGEAAKVAGQEYQVRRPAPLLGEHTHELLREVGVDDATIRQLEADHAISHA
jgi:crotonobetainyl-CoA:carnitine CoA-transferase CaiB-like acyl-CoA transferase